MFDDYPDVLTINQMSTALQISKGKAYDLVNEGLVKNLRVGRKILVPKCFLIEFITGIYGIIDVGVTTYSIPALEKGGLES